MQNLVVGKPAPEIDGVDFDGKPLKLSDYRGKVVALVFWGTWCGPCMAEVPHERELVEKYKGRPFAMLGVDCNEPKEVAAKVMESERITWPNWHDGEDSGPIADLYHVSGFPTVFVIDANGQIRSTRSHGDGLAKLVEQLVVEAEGETPKK
jgi:thiol-disulfide isomerase/thioredoxin